MLKAIFGEYAKIVRLVYERKERSREIREGEKFSIHITQIFIRIIDFIYIENFENEKFTSFINRYPQTVSGVLFYIIANSKTVLADSPSLYVTATDISVSFGVSQPTITAMYKKFCQLLNIEFKKVKRMHGRQGNYLIFSIPPKFTTD